MPEEEKEKTVNNLLAILSRIPAGLWEALKSGFSVLMLVLKGRQLEAELAQTKLREQAAKAKMHTAKNWGMRVVYEKQADQAAAEARELEMESAALDVEGEKERKRIENLSDAETHQEYMELVKRAKERAHETQQDKKRS